MNPFEIVMFVLLIFFGLLGLYCAWKYSYYHTQINLHPLGLDVDFNDTELDAWDEEKKDMESKASLFILGLLFSVVLMIGAAMASSYFKHLSSIS